MAAGVIRLEGDIWQSWANQLLSIHYGPTEYVRIADNDRGDAGIEGFSLTGHAYQCYGCEEPISTKERYERQRNKMTEDLGKFVKNAGKLSRLFGTTKIIRWVLFVPHYDSRAITEHANSKREEVVLAALPYVGDNFQVQVCDEEHFTLERDKLLAGKDEAISFTAEVATDETLTSWKADGANDQLLTKLNEKLGRLKTLHSEDDREAFRASILKWYLEGQQILVQLRNYPGTYKRIVEAKQHRQGGLVVKKLTHEGTGADLLNSTLKQLFEDYRDIAKEISRTSVEMLAREAIGDWLLRCPLDFPRDRP